ncbi:ABC transporter ATP-binding protein [Streptomyces sp. ISL-96]|uniref:ABC transporter ATP-binding protein n=1 Tax=Streptomyces sp. ISL-96 TaxID=2819191 RepID=UPI001BE7EFB5|nr:ABC transporter ATP-binding protein [Streptomyces sp. ISL-96]MBT2488866.1 ABC transporter ATP-binding protein [Streptomyces sp. ISL-96]
MTDTAIEAAALGKSYGRRGWALRECSFRLPAGRVCAVVGPNGAGKSTLLALAAGLLRPTEGSLTVLGTSPSAARHRIAYIAQDKPLYPQLTVADTLRLGAELNTGRWDARVADRVVQEGGLDLGARVRTLSGGQRTRVALALALGKRPELMLLDEPMADLDPLARHQLMGTLMAEAVEHGTTVVMSSHIIGELADACDHLLLVSGGRIRLGGGIDDLVAAHTLVTGLAPASDLAPHTVVESRASGRGTTALIRPEGPVGDDWEAEEPSLEEVLLAHLRSPDAPPLLTPGATALDEAREVTA